MIERFAKLSLRRRISLTIWLVNAILAAGLMAFVLR